MARAALALLLAAAFGLVFQYLFYREEIGLNAPVAVILLFVVGWRLRWAEPLRVDWWMPAMALAFAAFLAVRAEGAVVAFNVLAILTLAAAWSASLRGVTVSTLPVGRLLGEAWHSATGALWRAAPALPGTVRALPLGSFRQNRLLPTLTGIVLSLPLLVIFASLFTAADPVFSRWWGDLIALDDWEERLAEGSQRVVIALVIAWLVMSAISWRTAEREGSVAQRGLVRVDTVTAFLATIAALFAAFVVFQLAYLFGGRDTIADAGISYAQYARRGFFELLTVAFLTGVVLFVVDLLIARRAGAYLWVASVLIGLTAVILASSLYRLSLYQQAYGWSEQRLYAVAMIAAVAAALAILVWGLLTRRMAYAVPPIVFAALAVALIVNAIGPTSFVARAHASSTERSLDHYYLASLGRTAMADIVALRPTLSERDRFCLDAVLFMWYGLRDNDEAPSWQSWNLSRERTREALAWLRANVFTALPGSADTSGHQALGRRVAAECARQVGRPRRSRAPLSPDRRCTAGPRPEAADIDGLERLPQRRVGSRSGSSPSRPRPRSPRALWRRS